MIISAIAKYLPCADDIIKHIAAWNMIGSGGRNTTVITDDGNF